MVGSRSVARVVALYGAVILLSVVFAFPGVWTVLNSFRSISSLVGLFPSSWHWSNYRLAVTLVPFLDYAKNSVIISGITVCLTVVSSGLVGFGFARLSGPGKTVLFFIVLATMMLPGVVTQIPTYILFTRLGLTNTFWPWVFWGLGGNAFFIFLYRQFFLGIPKELEEAARLDGCSTFQIYWRIFLPISLPVVATVAIMAFQGSWSDALTPFMFLSSNMWPLATALVGANYTLPNQPTVQLVPVIDAATVLFIIPILAVFFLGQRFLLEGIVTTGLKG